MNFSIIPLPLLSFS
jgi:hypothetical protein